MGKISQNFVAFSEYMNFKYPSTFKEQIDGKELSNNTDLNFNYPC